MTKRELEAIARALRTFTPDQTNDPGCCVKASHRTKRFIARRIARTVAETSPFFDEDAFVKHVMREDDDETTEPLRQVAARLRGEVAKRLKLDKIEEDDDAVSDRDQG